MNKPILFVSHKAKQCGVYEFGRNVFNAISTSNKYDFIYSGCRSLDDVNGAIVSTHYLDQFLSISTKNLSSGIYFVNLYENNNLVQSEKVIIGK